MNDAQTMTPYIGQTVRARFEELTVLCRIVNVKSSYGRLRILVQPVSGSGEQWVEMSRITPNA